jgi:hypothetical protein
MKKTLLSLTLLFATSIIAHAQWTTSGTVTSTTNSVGISTSAPISTFQVNSGINKFSVGSVNYPGLNYGTSYVGFNAARTVVGSSTSWTIDGDNFHNGGGVIYADIYGNIYLSPLGSNGTTSRTLTDIDIKNSIALRVGADGVVYAKDVMISTTTFPDYVFKKGYTLPSLSEVKSYIDQHQHLPEIPSEQEVVKNVLNVAEMNKLLMKKVEELTLYAIENERKDKEREAAKDKLLASLQEQINALKQQQPTAPKKAKH